MRHDVILARINIQQYGEYAFQFTGIDNRNYLVPLTAQARELIIHPQRKTTTGIHAPTLVSTDGHLEVHGGLDLIVVNSVGNSVHPVQPHKVIRLGA